MFENDREIQRTIARFPWPVTAIARACVLLAAALLVPSSCASTQPAPATAGKDSVRAAWADATAPNRLSAEEAAAGFRLLFDGVSMTGWRSYRQEDVGEGWEAVEGELRGAGTGRDIITTEMFSDFELRFEFKIAPGGNSGVMYRVVESEEESYMSGPEYQILDDAAHPSVKPNQVTAANYGLDAPMVKPRPAGEWNQGAIVIRKGAVEHWLNGALAVAYVLGSPEWKEKVARSKFSAWPAFGMQAKGHICLQAHGSPVAFRNIRLRQL